MLMMGKIKLLAAYAAMAVLILGTAISLGINLFADGNSGGIKPAQAKTEPSAKPVVKVEPKNNEKSKSIPKTTPVPNMTSLTTDGIEVSLEVEPVEWDLGNNISFKVGIWGHTPAID